jgi:hypothetical protein
MNFSENFLFGTKKSIFKHPKDQKAFLKGPCLVISHKGKAIFSENSNFFGEINF